MNAEKKVESSKYYKIYVVPEVSRYSLLSDLMLEREEMDQGRLF